jgi:drug/metabolite transporter (DMT)-like permease
MDAGLARPRPGARVLTKDEAIELRSRTRQTLLALGMLVAGTANTLTCKATLSTVSGGRSTHHAGSNPGCHLPYFRARTCAEFNHPILMAACMFSGEVLCLIVHYVSSACRPRDRQAEVPKHIFALPAMADIIGTGIMYVGLTLTSASVYQMLRGSVIIFTSALSAIFLRRRQWGYHYVAMLTVFCGVLTVGGASSSDAVESRRAGNGALLGNALVIISQIFTASQMVVEERFLTGYSLPALVAVGWEGVWGLSIITCILVALQHTAVGDDGIPIEDSVAAMHQIALEPKLLLLMGGNALSIAFFNFFGMSITKSSSAAYRMVLDSLRTLVVVRRADPL